MKKLTQFAVVALMFAGLFAANSYPSHASIPGVMMSGPAPMPMCDPDDTSCDPGPMWPKMKSGPAPMPMCDPDDTSCDPGPMWPKAKAAK